MGLTNKRNSVVAGIEQFGWTTSRKVEKSPHMFFLLNFKVEIHYFVLFSSFFLSSHVRYILVNPFFLLSFSSSKNLSALCGGSRWWGNTWGSSIAAGAAWGRSRAPCRRGPVVVDIAALTQDTLVGAEPVHGGVHHGVVAARTAAGDARGGGGPVAAAAQTALGDRVAGGRGGGGGRAGAVSVGHWRGCRGGRRVVVVWMLPVRTAAAVAPVETVTWRRVLKTSKKKEKLEWIES